MCCAEDQVVDPDHQAAADEGSIPFPPKSSRLIYTSRMAWFGLPGYYILHIWTSSLLSALHPVFFISTKHFGEGFKLLNFGHFEAFSCIFHRDLLLNFLKLKHYYG